MNDDCSNALQSVPIGIESPIHIDAASQRYDFWTGATTLKFGERRIDGIASVFLDLLPAPEFRFELTPATRLWLKDTFVDPPLGRAVLEAGPPIGQVNVDVMTAGPAYTGYLQDQTGSDAASISGATFLVINGPDVNGSPIRRDRSAGCGRMCAEVDGMNITVDRLKFEKQDRRNTYATTHVARCDFAGKVSSDDIRSVAANLFRSLSLMKCRWVGVVGPWLHDTEGKPIGFRAMVTKTMRNGGAISWCHDTMHDAFSQLYPAVHGAFCDSGCSQSIQASLHWLVEAEQCSGGIEGAIILQQAALENLAWLEIVQRRRLCSESGFKALPASDKIRWLLSLNGISARIPAKSDSITSYAKAFNLIDMVDVLVEVRNALVHAEPKKVARLFGRDAGNEERGDLWYQIGGILQQALLASLGYRGRMLRRDVDATYAVGAVQSVPWASSS